MTDLRGVPTVDPDTGPTILPSTDGTGSGVGAARTLAFAPAGAVALVAVVSLLRLDVSPVDIALYAIYLLVGVVAPGTLIHRALRGQRLYLDEDLAFGALTGIACQIVAWLLLGALGLVFLTPFWWVVPCALFAINPSLRGHAVFETREARPVSSAWALAAVAIALIVRTDVVGLRGVVLPPEASETYIDLWWHLSLVQELMGSGPYRVPQVAGEDLSYHYFSHTHMAVGANSTGIRPELILFRLWVFPMLVLLVGLAGAAARELTQRVWAGPVAAWMSFGILVQHYWWPDRTVAVGQPFTILSPSQAYASAFVLAIVSALIPMVRGQAARGTWVWLAIAVLAGSSMKSTVLPVVFGGLVVAVVASMLIRRRVPLVPLAALAIVMVVQIWNALTNAVTWGSGIALFGLFRSSPVYNTLVDDTSTRALNEGLVLDSIDTPAAVGAAALALLFLLGTSAVRFVGLGSLAASESRSDPAMWLIAGAFGAGWAAGLVIDHVSAGQVYFLSTITPLGILLTLRFLVDRYNLVSGSTARRGGLVAGVAVGVFATLLVSHVVAARVRRGGYGTIEAVLFPALLAALIIVVMVYVWRRWSRSLGLAGAGAVVAVVAVMAVSAPSELDYYSLMAYRWIQPATEFEANPDGNWFVSAEEQQAMLWLRDAANQDDVMVTNVHCRAATVNNVYCDSRAFWPTGLSGVVAVTESWAYTPDALSLHGNDDISFVHQPSPWPNDLALSKGIVASPTLENLAQAEQAYSVDWIVVVRRYGEESPGLATLTDVVFENGAVAIYAP